MEATKLSINKYSSSSVFVLQHLGLRNININREKRVNEYVVVRDRRVGVGGGRRERERERRLLHKDKPTKTNHKDKPSCSEHIYICSEKEKYMF